MEEFNKFIQDNYYGIIPYGKYLNMFNEWLDLEANKDKAVEFAVENGFSFIDDIMADIDVAEDFNIVGICQDVSEYAEPFFLAEAYYCYVVDCTREMIVKYINQGQK